LRASPHAPLLPGVREVRTLFVTPDAPYPPRSGALLRNWVNINAMAQLGPVAVFSVGEVAPDLSSLPGVAAWRHHGDGGPSSVFTSASSMLRRLVRPREFHVTDARHAREISLSLSEFARSFKPDITIVENWLDAFPACLSGVGGKIVVDAHNVESVLQSQMLRSTKSALLVARSYVRWFFARGIERRLFETADDVWLTSQDDVARLRTITKRPVPCRVIPNAIDVARYDVVRSGAMHAVSAVPQQAHSICYIGLFRHPPNKQAAHLLIDEILPKLRERFPDARLVLVGRDPTEKMLHAAQRDAGIVVTGSVADTRSYLAACDLTVIPLTTGGGTRLKILEAFAAGVPVVSTPVGAEGLEVRDGEQLLIRDTVEGLVEASTAIWEDRARAMALAARAYVLVDGNYSAHAIASRIRTATARLLERDDLPARLAEKLTSWHANSS
jgi:glycosyltransferase involved in cell wall biosynthesis